jgi:MOSC domain-containing protein YiiM
MLYNISMSARVVSIQVGMPKQLGDPTSTSPMTASWTTAFYKSPISGPVQVQQLGLEGDGQADLTNHGGVDKAVLGYAAVHYIYWKEHLGKDVLDGGAFGENLTIHGQTEASVCIGDRWQLGNCVLEVSQPRQPCWKLGRRWQEKMLPKWVVQTGFSGWYYRVVAEGTIHTNIEMHLVSRPNPQWSVARANDILYGREIDATAMTELMLLDTLSASWKESLG